MADKGVHGQATDYNWGYLGMYTALNTGTTHAGVYGANTSPADGSIGAGGWFYSTNGYGIYSQGPKNYFQGSVGIGTTSPLGNLNVNGGSWTDLVLTDNTTKGWYVRAVNGDLQFNIKKANDSGVYYAGPVFKPDGTVGIGTTTPVNESGTKLDVNGLIKTSGIRSPYGFSIVDRDYAKYILNQS